MDLCKSYHEIRVVFFSFLFIFRIFNAHLLILLNNLEFCAKCMWSRAKWARKSYSPLCASVCVCVVFF